MKRKHEEEFDYEMKPDGDHAQILIEIYPSSKPYAEAKKIIESLGIHILKVTHLSLNRILLELDAEDMRGAALKLSENGFLNIKGYNPTSSKP